MYCTCPIYTYVLSKVWNTKDGRGGRTKDSYEWTSLRGHDKRVLLRKLPPKIPSLVHGEAGDNVKELWIVCLQFHSM